MIFTFFEPESSTLHFSTRWKGKLQVTRQSKLLELNFPADIVNTATQNQALIESIGTTPVEYLKSETDVLLVYQNQAQIEALQPNFFELSKLPLRGIITTAPGNDVDFVSRFFAPAKGINEDPVTGSAHTTLLPYWSKKLGKDNLLAKQLSKRGGTLHCKIEGKRVKIAGKALLYLEGTIVVD